jgi:pilus assembly protein Flp/PilA
MTSAALSQFNFSNRTFTRNFNGPKKILLMAARHGRRAYPFRSFRLMSNLLEFLRNESGATAIEYGLIAAGISVAIIAVVNGLGTSLNASFKGVSDQLK